MAGDSYVGTLEKIWLSSPHMGGTEINYINDAFSHNWIAPMGPNVEGFEKDLEAYLQSSSHIAVLSSGTAALHLALINCGVSAGDEVICQSLTFSASANPIVYQGAVPVFVDSETDTWNMCPQALEIAIVDRLSKGKKVKAVIVVHLYGMPAKMNEILAVANRFNIPVIEDAAEAVGSSYNAKKCGTFGMFGILSFNGNKIITTSGGGALVCKDIEAKKHTLFLATQARDEAPHYEHSHIGYNYRLSNISAGIGRGQMEVLEQRVEQRRAFNALYRDFFKDVKGVTVLTEPSTSFFSNHWLTAVVINQEATGITKEQLLARFAAANIEARPLWKPMHMQPVFKSAAYYGGTVAQDLFQKGVCLPSGSNMSASDWNRITDVLTSLFNNSEKNNTADAVSESL